MYPNRRAPRRGFPGNRFTPAELFRGGVNGVWFDPSDMAALYQDATGLIPVTAKDQPVGLMLDKSVLSGHSARRNLLAYTEDFSNGYWTNINATVTANSITAPDGTLTADLMATASINSRLTRNVVTTYSGAHTYSFYAKAGTGGQVQIVVYNLTKSAYLGGAGINLATGIIAEHYSGVSNISSVGNGWYRLSLQVDRISANDTIRCYVYANYSGEGHPKSVYIWGAQLEVGTLTDYQRVTTGLGDWTPGNHASQTTDSKRPMLRSDGRLWWLDYDGIDDVLNITAAVAPGSSTLVDNRVSALTTTTGVNVGTSYALPTNDSYGYLIKPPSLSAEETARLTRYFNIKAGR